MMNKKFLAALLAILMVLALVLAGCANRSSESSSDQQSSVPVIGVEDWDDMDPVISNSASASQSQSQSGSQSGSHSNSTSTSQSSSKLSSTSNSQSNSSSASGSVSASGKEEYGLSYEEYLAMSPQERQAYCETFASMKEFKAWRDAAKDEYEANNGHIKIEGDNDIYLPDYIQ